MKRKSDEKERFCSSRNKLDSNPIDLNMATVTRLPARSPTKSHQNKLLCRGQSSVRLGGAMKRKELDRDEDNEKDTKPSKLDSLPLDLKTAILIRLPAKSLTKLRCVSKMWYSFIRSRGFVDSYFSMSSKRSRFVVALTNSVVGEPEERLTFFFLFSHDEGGESSSLVPIFEMAMPGLVFSSGYGCCTSSHGFLTVHADLHRLIYCNPSTEQVIKLPTNSRYVGYDPIDDQHKVLSTYSKFYGQRLEHKVLTLGGGQGWRSITDIPVPYCLTSSTASICINGFLYYGAHCLSNYEDLFLVCFDVRSEKLSIINAPHDALQMKSQAMFIEYKGKLASIVRNPYGRACTFQFWILEDLEKHEWSNQTFVFPSSLWDSVGSCRMLFPGTNKAGEIIMAPEALSRNVQPFYIFYYNLETKHIRRVRLLGIGDHKGFRRSYGFVNRSEECHVRIAPQHVESIAFI